MEIRAGDLDCSQVKTLLLEHHQDMMTHSPIESVHTLDISKLQASDISFWTIWLEQELAGFGALKQLSSHHGEIKSMRTAKKHLRKGVSATLLEHILLEAKSRNYHKVSLETGTAGAFTPAHLLYRRFGFTECPPFADYQYDPFSLFMSKAL